MKLNLKRPLAFFDIESTGTNVGSDRIVELSVIKMNPDGSEEVKTWRMNPGMPIPLESSLVHGIYDEHIKDEPAFGVLAASVAEFIGDSDLAGYNSNKFDIPMLMEEFLRVGINFDLENRFFVDVQNIFHQMEQRTLKAAYLFYCNKQIINAHSAEADTRATMEVLLAQIEKYEGKDWEDKAGKISKPVVNDIEALHKFTNLNRPLDFAGRMVYNDKGEELFNFGKHKGKRVEDVFNAEPSYFSWMMQGDFPLYTKQKLEEVYNRWNAKRAAERQQQRPVQPRPADNTSKPVQPKPVEAEAKPAEQRPAAIQPKKEFHKPDNRNNQHQNRPQFKKQDDGPAKPVDDDMLSMLRDKFKKGL
ncbi:exonuclease domain-containing protein [Mucilaginibacter ginsenosidivorans]|uniref:DNA polymerase III subunit epsilon n=1 Tax=Mucilaginibacter ginsenosidivorans TaxID=398053 RepID=A0A5B8UXV6_9SPHI|nr:exonuclease domain-containing protein [Mucilaginibacter ginsenosidivorans]QEC63525.1 DNA polymerase III subunit epsilon [Mucilaginibacter ginsenosidivorans]